MNQLYTQLRYSDDLQQSNIEECNIVLIEGVNNSQYQISYDDLDAGQKRKVDDFMQLIKSLSPSNNP